MEPAPVQSSQTGGESLPVPPKAVEPSMLHLRREIPAELGLLIANIPVAENSRNAAGERNGVWGRTYANGKNKWIATFVDGRKNGWKFHWSERGILDWIQEYQNDVPGNSFVWDALGGLAFFARVSGILHGDHFAWHPTGEIRLYSTYVDGELQGLCVEWFQNWVVKSQCVYLDNKVHGLYKTWYSNGILECCYNYENGMRHGLCETWDWDGIPTSSHVFVFDVKQK